MKLSEYIAPVLLILASIVILVILRIFSYVSTIRTLTGLEWIIVQIFALVVGLFGSFIFGRQSATKAGREIIKPHARSALLEDKEGSATPAAVSCLRFLHLPSGSRNTKL